MVWFLVYTITLGKNQSFSFRLLIS